MLPGPGSILLLLDTPRFGQYYSTCFQEKAQLTLGRFYKRAGTMADAVHVQQAACAAK